MRALATVLWHFPFLGFLTAIYTLVAGAMFVATGVGAPIGTGLFELGKFLFAPFGHRMVDASLLQTELSRNTVWRVWGWMLMVIWLPFGLLAAFVLILQVFFCCITIIGIPAGVAAARSIGPMLNPVGKKVITADLYNEIMRRKASVRADAFLAPGVAAAGATTSTVDALITFDKSPARAPAEAEAALQSIVGVAPTVGDSEKRSGDSISAPIKDIRQTIPTPALWVGAGAAAVIVLGSLIAMIGNLVWPVQSQRVDPVIEIATKAVTPGDSDADRAPEAGGMMGPSGRSVDSGMQLGSKEWCLAAERGEIYATMREQEAYADACFEVLLDLIGGPTEAGKVPGSLEWCLRFSRGKVEASTEWNDLAREKCPPAMGQILQLIMGTTTSSRILQPDAGLRQGTEQTLAVSAGAPKDIVDTAIAAGQFTRFVALVQSRPNSEGMLRRKLRTESAPKTTVLMPTDEAFAALPVGMIDDLLKPENQGKLGLFIMRHVLTYDSGVEHWGQDRMFELKTLQGGTLNAIRGADGTVTINNATLSQQRILATNGVIIGVDRVLMPPADFQLGNPEPTTSSSGRGQTQTQVDNVEAYSPARTVLTTGNGARIREQPSTAAKVLWFLGRDSALDVIGKSRQADGVWYQIRYATLDAQMQPVTRLGFVRSDLTNSKQE